MVLFSSIGLLMAVCLLAQAPAASPTADCQDWRECRQQALDAAGRRDYERFHDLAWRTVQKGPPRDPELMYLLARAQSLSGRPHDALVMIGRLAEAGFMTTAATSPDFERIRTLPDWPAVRSRVLLTWVRVDSLPSLAARGTRTASSTAAHPSHLIAPVAPDAPDRTPHRYRRNPSPSAGINDASGARS